MGYSERAGPKSKEKTLNTIEELDERRGHTSASNAAADKACRGRHLAQKGLPRKDTRFSKSGDQVHDALARRDPSGLSPEQRETYDHCLNIEGNLLQQFFGEHLPKVKTFVELRLWVKFKAPDGKEYEHSGRFDKIHRYATRAMIVEYKTLYGDVPEAPTNEQCRDGVALAKGHFVTVDEIAVVVIQPHATLDPTPAVYDVPSMQRAEQDMFARVVASNDPTSPRTAGESQCAYCLAKMNCHEYNQWAGSMVIGMHNVMDVPVAQWTGEQCAIYCKQRGIAKKWLTECDESIKARLEANPEAVPGYQLRPGSVREAITNPQECFNRFAKLGGTIEQFMTTIAIGKSRLKDALARVTGAKGKALEQAVALLTDGIVKTSRTAPSIVAADGTGEAEEEE